MKFILPIIFVGVAIVGFFTVTEPLYSTITLEKEQIASYNEALDNSKALDAQRDELTQKYNSFDPNNIDKLQKLLPDSVDNIRLILEIENIASPYGMVLKNVKYDDTTDTAGSTATQTSAVQGNAVGTSLQNYGTWNLEFSTQGTYGNFVSFLKDIEDNLRIVDISSIDFSSDSNTSNINTSIGLNPSLPQSYNYDFKIRTYWLKN